VCCADYNALPPFNAPLTDMIHRNIQQRAGVARTWSSTNCTFPRTTPRSTILFSSASTLLPRRLGSVPLCIRLLGGPSNCCWNWDLLRRRSRSINSGWAGGFSEMPGVVWLFLRRRVSASPREVSLETNAGLQRSDESRQVIHNSHV